MSKDVFQARGTWCGPRSLHRIKKWPVVPDQIPYHTYAQYPILWSRGNGILSEVDEVDSLPSEEYRRVREAVSG